MQYKPVVLRHGTNFRERRHLGWGQLLNFSIVIRGNVDMDRNLRLVKRFVGRCTSCARITGLKGLVLLLAGAGPLVLFHQAGFAFRDAKETFGLKHVVERARKLAQRPFEEPNSSVPDFLMQLNYDQYRDIRFRPEKALWKKGGLPFQAQFFHPGFYFNRAVKINMIDGRKIQPLVFSSDLFNYGMNDFKDRVPKDLGFAGFRFHYPLYTRDYFDEVAVFLGASYFRAVGKGQRFGLSARALAIDTALASGEEFPFFREFWLQKPSPGADRITLYALVDSRSVTGAYRFTIRPGEATIIDVTGTVFLRRPVGKLGIAPLTSMFFYGENTNRRPNDDFRPEVHDSDGLLVFTGDGQWIWRPLVNPGTLLDTIFQLQSPRGFGIFQRDRDFDHYQDLEADYHLRPSVWIMPAGGWGPGGVELVQIPEKEEVHDNIVAFWVPAAQPEVGKPYTFSYRMKWLVDDLPLPLGRVVATRTCQGRQEGTREYLVDFAGGKLKSLPKDAPVTAGIEVGGGKVVEQHIVQNPATGGWRLSFDVLPSDQGVLQGALPDRMKKPLELRALLRLNDEILTETWSYVVFP
jgi:glucans biosynthesis protein